MEEKQKSIARELGVDNDKMKIVVRAAQAGIIQLSEINIAKKEDTDNMFTLDRPKFIKL
ncbi:MAG: hypothetical protein ACKVTZ_13055 [Bacteroidia bacterium]